MLKWKEQPQTDVKREWRDVEGRRGESLGRGGGGQESGFTVFCLVPTGVFSSGGEDESEGEDGQEMGIPVSDRFSELGHGWDGTDRVVREGGDWYSGRWCPHSSVDREG